MGLIAGSYTYTVQAVSGSVSNSNSVDVVVNDSPNPPVSGGNQAICESATIPAISVSVNAGETVDWYDASSGGNLLLSGNTNYTPSGGGSFFAEARNIAAGCLSTTRTEVVLTTTSCKVITNRRITYRAKPN